MLQAKKAKKIIIPISSNIKHINDYINNYDSKHPSPVPNYILINEQSSISREEDELQESIDILGNLPNLTSSNKTDT